MTKPSYKRRQAQKRGQRAEALCAWFLRLKGYRILEQGWRCPMGEIDIIARRGKILVFAEVKQRARLEDALGALSPRQQQRIARAALAYSSKDAKIGALDMRFDLLALTTGLKVHHIKNAWVMKE